MILCRDLPPAIRRRVSAIGYSDNMPEWRNDAGGALEREIANCFRRIADNGWFPESLDEGSEQLKLVREVLAPGPGMQILDAGCARGRFLRQLTSSGARLFGTDLTEVFLQSARGNVPEAALAAGSLSRLPFRTGAFDAVFCIEVLEHVPDTDAALGELARVLKPGGTLLVIDKNLMGLHPASGVPNAIWKPWMERRGRWMYPADFRFREKWFWPRSLARLMERHFESVSVRFPTDGFGKASRVYRALPGLSFEAAWIGSLSRQNEPLK